MPFVRKGGGCQDLAHVHRFALVVWDLDADHAFSRNVAGHANGDGAHGPRQIVLQCHNAADLGARCRLKLELGHNRPRLHSRHLAFDAVVEQLLLQQPCHGLQRCLAAGAIAALRGREQGQRRQHEFAPRGRVQSQFPLPLGGSTPGHLHGRRPGHLRRGRKSRFRRRAHAAAAFGTGAQSIPTPGEREAQRMELACKPVGQPSHGRSEMLDNPQQRNVGGGDEAAQDQCHEKHVPADGMQRHRQGIVDHAAERAADSGGKCGYGVGTEGVGSHPCAHPQHQRQPEQRCPPSRPGSFSGHDAHGEGCQQTRPKPGAESEKLVQQIRRIGAHDPGPVFNLGYRYGMIECGIMRRIAVQGHSERHRRSRQQKAQCFVHQGAHVHTSITTGNTMGRRP